MGWYSNLLSNPNFDLGITFMTNSWLNDTWMIFFCHILGSAWVVLTVMMMGGGRGRFGTTSRLLLVGFLFVSVSCSVLDVGRAGAQPIQVTTVLSVVDVILEEHLSHLEEGHSCE